MNSPCGKMTQTRQRSWIMPKVMLNTHAGHLKQESIGDRRSDRKPIRSHLLSGLWLALLLPLLAACPPPSSHLSDPSALGDPLESAARQLDGGVVTPIQHPIPVSFGPFPISRFDIVSTSTLVGNYDTVNMVDRYGGTMSGEAAGNVIAIRIATDQESHEGASVKPVIFKGSIVTLFVARDGGLKNAELSRPGLDPDSAEARDLLQQVKADESIVRLPASGSIGQGQTVMPGWTTMVPKESGLAARPLTGTVRGQGSYKGRAVVLWVTSEDVVIEGQAVRIRGYGLYDLATGMWLHFEAESRFSMPHSGFRIAYSQVRNLKI
jgi:hypothetical protein